MLAGAEQGHPPAAEIGWQAVESMFKFHVSYLGLSVLGLALPRNNARQRALAGLLVFVQWPVGVAIYVGKHDDARKAAPVMARFTRLIELPSGHHIEKSLQLEKLAKGVVFESVHAA